MRAVAPSAALAGAAPLRLTIRARNLPSARAKSASPALARPPLAGRALVARHPPRRRVACLVPSAVATGGDDVKVGSFQESSKSAGDDGECAIKSDGQIECLGAETPEGAETTAAPPSRGDGGGDISDAPPRGGGGGGGGGGDDGGGGGDDEGDEGEESSVPSPLSPSAATAALAGWASAAANGAKGASDLAALRSAVDGGIGAAVASLFGLNLVAATALRGHAPSSQHSWKGAVRRHDTFQTFGSTRHVARILTPLIIVASVILRPTKRLVQRVEEDHHLGELALPVLVREDVDTRRVRRPRYRRGRQGRRLSESMCRSATSGGGRLDVAGSRRLRRRRVLQRLY